MSLTNELEKQLSDCRRLIGITDDAPLVEALRLYIAESDEQLEEANKQLGCYRAKAEEEMSQSEQETGDKPSEHYIRKARGDSEPDSGGATVAPEGQIIKAVVPTSICPSATITMDLKTDAPESSTAGLLEKINELRMTTARNDTRQEIHRRWLYECRDLLFSEELRAALADIARRQELIDLHENEIATQRDELKGLRGLQSEQAAEMKRLKEGLREMANGSILYSVETATTIIHRYKLKCEELLAAKCAPEQEKETPNGPAA